MRTALQTSLLASVPKDVFDDPIFQVIYEIAKLIRKDTTREAMPMTVFSGVLTGMMLLWVTGLFIKFSTVQIRGKISHRINSG